MLSASSNVSRRRAAALGGLGLIAAVAVVASGSTTVGAVEQPPPSLRPMISVIPPDQSAAYAALGGSSSAAALLAPDAGPYGANLSLARPVTTPLGLASIVPGDGTVCLRGEDEVGAAWSCGPASRVENGVLMLSLHDRDTGNVSVFGLVPDDAGTVTVTTAAGTDEVTVADNVFSLALREDDDAIVHAGGLPGEYRVP